VCNSTRKKSVSPAAAKPATPVAAKPAYVPAPAPVVEQYALDRLKQMSDTLIASKSFSYRSESSIELQSKTGQFITFFTEVDVALQRPNKLRMNLSGDTHNLQLYFDGAKASAFHKDDNAYVVSPPLMSKNLTHAIVVGESMVNGVPYEHFAYMEPAINWEIWIEKGKNALPLRLAMTYKQAQNFPRFMVEYRDWNLNPKLKANTFVFNAPADSKQIELSSHPHEQKSK
jgi:hypothetical protein